MTPTFVADANILLRTAEPAHRQHQEAVDATRELVRRGYTAHVFPQGYYEFWVAATRPVARNGLGMTPAQASAELNRLKTLFALLRDTPDVYDEWERLVIAHTVSGKPAHDARLVAAMNVHGVGHILTFNDADFRRFPGITVLTPAVVLAWPPVAPATRPPTP
jgi:predicted nucleic acid-binding protein